MVFPVWGSELQDPSAILGKATEKVMMSRHSFFLLRKRHVGWCRPGAEQFQESCETQCCEEKGVLTSALSALGDANEDTKEQRVVKTQRQAPRSPPTPEQPGRFQTWSSVQSRLGEQ